MMLSKQPATVCSRWLASAVAFAVVALTALALLGVACAQTTTKAKLLPSAKPSDCAGCHGKVTPLPKAHTAIAGKSLSDCRGCHPKQGPMALEGRLSLSHIHQLGNVTCKSCHANVRKPEAPQSAQCLNCHSGEAIFAATSAVKPRNPHGSPHYGKENDCNLCHHQHKKSENFCNECHQFDFRVP